MAYSSAEINRISGSRLAVQGRKYIEQNGNIWIGTKDNRLTKQFIKDKNIGVELNATDPIASLKKTLQELNSKNDLTEEFLNSYKWAQKTGYKSFEYDLNGNISEQNIYTDSSPLKQLLFNVLYTYTGDNLTKVSIVNSDNSFRLQKEFTYDTDNNLTNIKIT